MRPDFEGGPWACSLGERRGTIPGRGQAARSIALRRRGSWPVAAGRHRTPNSGATESSGDIG